MLTPVKSQVDTLPEDIDRQIQLDLQDNMFFSSLHKHGKNDKLKDTCLRCAEERGYTERVISKFQISIAGLRTEYHKKCMNVTQKDIDLTAALARSEAQMELILEAGERNPKYLSLK
ncbi:hypothetical protein V1511DRAFT_493783 [Dipodascopsis uninucleata]